MATSSPCWIESDTLAIARIMVARRESILTFQRSGPTEPSHPRRTPKYPGSGGWQLIHKLPTTPTTAIPTTATPAAAIPTAAVPTAAAPLDAAPTATAPTAAATARRRRRRNPDLTAAATGAAGPIKRTWHIRGTRSGREAQIRGVRRCRLQNRRDGDNTTQQKIALHWFSPPPESDEKPPSALLVNTFFVRLLQSQDFF
jgi:hypothetical protein